MNRQNFYRIINALTISMVIGLAAGCATAPEVVYVKEAQQVTTQALEPVMLESADLGGDISNKFADKLSGISADELTVVVQTEIANTKRFKKVLLNSSEGDTYIIQPRIDLVEGFSNKIPTDPTRKRFTVKTRVRLDVLFYNQNGQKELIKSFYDERKLEEKISAKVNLEPEQIRDYYRRAINTAFRSAADQLGNGFNPSYEIGELSQLNDRTAVVTINTSKVKKVPKKQQAIEVLDNDNKVAAGLSEIIVNDGSVVGKVFQAGGTSVKPGMKVRARINAMLMDI